MIPSIDYSNVSSFLAKGNTGIYGSMNSFSKKTPFMTPTNNDIIPVGSNKYSSHADISLKDKITGKVNDRKDMLANETMYDKIDRQGTGLGIFETAMSLASGAQAIFAKPTTVSRPKEVNLTTPKLKYEGEATRSAIRENLATSVNTSLERNKELGLDPSRSSVGIISQANKVMRGANVQAGNELQQFSNQKEMVIADTENKETMINTESDNRFIERKDAALGADSARRGQQFSASISSMGSIFSRLMNEKLGTNMMRLESEKYETNKALAALGLDQIV